MPRTYGYAALAVFVLISCLTSGCSEIDATDSSPSPQAAANDSAASTTGTGAAQPSVTTSFSSVPQAIDSLSEATLNHNNDQARAATDWLVLQGGSAVQPLADVISDERVALEVRVAACRVLGKLGPPARQALYDAAGSENSYIRLKAISGLGGLQPTDEETVEFLMALLDSEDENTLREALRALGNIGAPAAVSVDRLQQIFNDTSYSDSVRGQARESLEKIDPRNGLQSFGTS